MPRGYRVVASFLAVLKAGGCYVPIDPEYPVARQQLMRDDSGSVRALTADGCRRGRRVSGLGAAPRPDRREPGLHRVHLRVDGPAEGCHGRAPQHLHVRRRAPAHRGAGRNGRPDGLHRLRRGHVRDLGCAALTAVAWSSCRAGGRSGSWPTRCAASVQTGCSSPPGIFHLMVEHDPTALSAVGTLQAGGDVLAPAQFCRASTEPRRHSTTRTGRRRPPSTRACTAPTRASGCRRSRSAPRRRTSTWSSMRATTTTTATASARFSSAVVGCRAATTGARA